MKKKLQTEIAELANELIAATEPFNVSTIKQKIQHIYDKLVVLQYLEGQLEDADESVDSKSFREQNWFVEPEPLPQPELKEEIVEPVMEKIKDIVAQMPQESTQVDDLLEEVLPESKYMKNDLEEFAANYQEMPIFERKEPELASGGVAQNIIAEEKKEDIPEEIKPKSINDVVNTGLNIGLNDRLAFVKHLFNENSEDYTRVLSQISTMTTYEEADTFIKGKVKPDYNYWLNKDEYAERFMAIIEKRFN